MENVKTALATDSRYRPEIQGVRAVGAFLIAVCHIWFVKVSGGVDVFFVVSGFLMSGVLLRQYAKTDSINVLGFWARIIRRITPSAYFIILLTLFAAMLWLPAPLWYSFIREAVFTTLHLENIHLMRASVDYLARDVPPSPVQQFWALSIQMQFYFVWPFIFLLAGWLAKKTRSGIAPFVIALASITLLSFLYALYATPANPGPAYFDPATRIWEFAAGGLCAILLPYIPTTQRLRTLCGWAGMLLILACAALLPRTVHFPGYVALMPVAGAVLVLFAGTSGSRYGVDRLLSSRPLVALGGLAFTFYLWHWPVLVFFLEATEQTHVGLLDGLIIIAISLCGAYLTMRFIEQPIGRSSFGRAKTWYTYALGAALAVPIVGTAALWRNYIHNVVKEVEAGTLATASQHVATTLTVLQDSANNVPLSQLITAKINLPDAYNDGCQQSQSDPKVLTCDYGQTSTPRKTIALVGGSHSTQWLPALETIGKKNSLEIVNITKGSCTFGAVSGTNASCREWNERVIDELAQLRPDAIMTIATRPVFDAKPKGIIEDVPTEYIQQWQKVEQLGIGIIAIRDNPWFHTDVANCVARKQDKPLDCALPRKSLLLPSNPAEQIKPKIKNLSLIDMTSYLCTETTCPVVSQNILMYRDKHHLSVPYVQSLTSALEQKMRLLRPDLFISDHAPAPLLAKKPEAIDKIPAAQRP